MNKEKIESKAMDYAGLTDDSKDSYARERGARCIAFKDGVRWVLETLCELPLDEMIRELAEYAHERIGGSPWADHLSSRMMRDSLDTGLSKSADAQTSPDSGELGGKGGAR